LISFNKILGALIGATILLLPAQSYAASAYTLVPEQYGMQLKSPDGRVVFEYVTRPYLTQCCLLQPGEYAFR
jgi:hypothetical protein